MRNSQFGRVLGPKRRKMDILAYFAPSVHLDSFALEFGQLKFYGCAWVGCGDLELEPELIPHEVVGAGADSLPLDAVFGRLNFEPIVVLLLVRLDVGDDGFEFLLEPLSPLLVFWTRVHAQEWDVVRSLFDGADHVELI